MFKIISRDPTEELQKKTNKLITKANIEAGSSILTPIKSSYGPAYLYGNVKTHKPHNPLRPIIAQVTSPVYITAKEIDKIIKPYIHKKFSLNSRDELIELLRVNTPDGEMASLDVTSLFSNVPVRETVDIILNNMYNNDAVAAPKIQRETMESLLLLCTTESPFRSPDSKLYYQINGVAMGSPPGPTFAEFYICELENRVLLNDHLKPNLYARYVDDIFVVVRDELHLNSLKMEMEAQSVLSFTFEMNINNAMSFLDVKIHKENQYETTVFRKQSDTGKCLNPLGECPDRYKRSVIRAYLHRAHKTCSSDHLLRQETLRIKQILINNGFTNTDVDREISKFSVTNKI